MTERPEAVKKLEIGEEYWFENIDEDGFSKMSPWGLEIPRMKIYVEKFHQAKRICWDYATFEDFIYESCSRGVSCDRFDTWMGELTGIRTYVLRHLTKNQEKFKELDARRMEYNRTSVKTIQDLDNTSKRLEPLELKLAELKQKARVGVLARLDPEFREKTDQNITGNIAQIIIPKKEDDIDE